ncbi:MAG TPA: hypothetical protein VFO05_12215 [Candidatus Limnocylindrales bacterium]|nr:hypothetical protein [Candidatus Limnocylindrales bacterium]
MQDAEEDLRATSESIQDDADRLKALEEEKADVEAGDPRLSTLSDEAERLAHSIAAKTTVERVLSDELKGG